MAKYAISTRRDVYTQDTTINDKTFSGWLAQNIGAADAEVMGITIAPGETLDMTHVSDPDVIWTGPISVKCNGTTVVVVRIQYHKRKERQSMTRRSKNE